MNICLYVFSLFSKYYGENKILKKKVKKKHRKKYEFYRINFKKKISFTDEKSLLFGGNEKKTFVFLDVFFFFEKNLSLAVKNVNELWGHPLSIYRKDKKLLISMKCNFLILSHDNYFFDLEGFCLPPKWYHQRISPKQLH